jgi:hypothetical protein
MTDRTSLPAKSIEALCVNVLKTQLGLRDVEYVKIRSYKGPKSWTWEISEMGTKKAGASSGVDVALMNASEAIGKLQQHYDVEK